MAIQLKNFKIREASDMQYKYPMIDLGKTGEWLRYLCKRNNLSVLELQEKLKIASNQAIYSWFNGKTPDVKSNRRNDRYPSVS